MIRETEIVCCRDWNYDAVLSYDISYLLPRIIVSFFRLLTLLCAFLLSGLPGRPVLAADLGVQTGRTLAGIIGYARWPVEPSYFRLCTAGYLAYLPGNGASLAPLLDRKLLIRDVTDLSAGWENGCDIIYMGALPLALQRQVIKVASGRPLLSVTEGDLECTAGSMFCLHAVDGEIGLLANLDAISRGSVRISPKVLQLVRRRQETSSEKSSPGARAQPRQVAP